MRCHIPNVRTKQQHANILLRGIYIFLCFASVPYSNTLKGLGVEKEQDMVVLCMGLAHNWFWSVDFSSVHIFLSVPNRFVCEAPVLITYDPVECC